MARVTLVRVDSTVGSVSPSSGFLRGNRGLDFVYADKGGCLTGAWLTLMFLMTNSSLSRSLASALDSAFFNKFKMCRTDFSGHRPEERVSLGLRTQSDDPAGCSLSPIFYSRATLHHISPHPILPDIV